jgi:hypothetical protein
MSYGVWIKWGWKCRIVYVDTGGYWWILRKLLYYIVFICILVFLRYLGHAFGGNAGQVSSLTGRSIALLSSSGARVKPKNLGSCGLKAFWKSNETQMDTEKIWKNDATLISIYLSFFRSLSPSLSVSISSIYNA